MCVLDTWTQNSLLHGTRPIYMMNVTRTLMSQSKKENLHANFDMNKSLNLRDNGKSLRLNLNVVTFSVHFFPAKQKVQYSLGGTI